MIIYALVPLRKNSSSIKNKNFIKIKKKPTYLYAVNQAIKSKYISKVFIATNSKKIKTKNKKTKMNKSPPQAYFF